MTQCYSTYLNFGYNIITCRISVYALLAALGTYICCCRACALTISLQRWYLYTDLTAILWTPRTCDKI